MFRTYGNLTLLQNDDTIISRPIVDNRRWEDGTHMLRVEA